MYSKHLAQVKSSVSPKGSSCGGRDVSSDGHSGRGRYGVNVVSTDSHFCPSFLPPLCFYFL